MERSKFEDVSGRDDQKYELFKIAKRIIKTNHDISEQCIRNANRLLTVSDENKLSWDDSEHRICMG